MYKWDEIRSNIMASYLFCGPGGKFIVIQAMRGTETKRIVWATGLCNHVSLDEQCHAQLPQGDDNVRFEVIGGGEIRGHLKSFTFYVWGESPEYGAEPNRQETVQIIDQFFLNWKAVGTAPPEGIFKY